MSRKANPPIGCPDLPLPTGFKRFVISWPSLVHSGDDWRCVVARDRKQAWAKFERIYGMTPHGGIGSNDPDFKVTMKEAKPY